MVLAVAAILDVVQIVAGLFAKEAEGLRAGHVELLLATGLIALHAGAHLGSTTFAGFFTNITILQYSLNMKISLKVHHQTVILFSSFISDQLFLIGGEMDKKKYNCVTSQKSVLHTSTLNYYLNILIFNISS